VSKHLIFTVWLPLDRLIVETIVGSLHIRYPAYRIKSKTRSKSYCHMSYNSRFCLHAREGSGAATCPTAPDPASLLGRVLVLPRAPRLRTPSSCSGGLRRCHVFHGTRPRLPAQEGFDVATCPTASETVSLLGRALMLPHVSWLSMSHIHQE
jgi:hypothetical protein